MIYQEEEITSKFKVIEELKSQLVKLDAKRTKLSEDINEIINIISYTQN